MALVWTYILLAAACYVTARLFPRPGYINPWEIEYNLYYGSGNDIDISKMFLLPPLEPSDAYDDEDGKNDSNHYVKREDENVTKIIDRAKDDLEQAYEDLRTKMLFKDFDDDLKMEKEMFPDRVDMVEKVKNVSNVIRRFRNTRRESNYFYCWGRCYLDWWDEDDPDWFYYSTEQRKRMMLVDLTLAFLVHMRYKVKDAAKVRHFVKNDKRYMMGYLFNRLRRLMYDIRKIFTAQMETERSLWQREIALQVKVHRTFVQLERDVRDLVERIRIVYFYHMEPEYFAGTTVRPTRSKKKRGNQTKAPKTTTTMFGAGKG